MHQGGPQALRKVLIANRGEIAVRIARACRDQNIASVGIYANSDRDAPHVTLVDEAFSLNGDRAADTYLDSTKILDIARRSGADAVHPGYGFLAENADFAQAVLDAGLTWIGPSPSAIEALGDKVSARQIAQRVGAPLVAGTPDPVANEAEVIAFAQEHGLPVAIKAAFGGGGRGLKVAHTLEEIPELYSSAVREAVAAFGRGECFVERFLHRPRHVETQCLADQHGNVVVVSTRDCSLQRRHQKLVEEAPAPFLTPAQETLLREASVAIMNEAKYVGAGTCEFLIGEDGTISFLEVNTRLQVEHTISEEISGIDLVAEQLRIAAGEELGYTHVATRGHSLEFRINGEDPYAQFLPQPGAITTLDWPSGPGVRVDAGVKVGNVISGAFDSMIAKIIVTGPTRQAAIARARRALGETVIEGLTTVIPFHQAVLDSPDFNAEEAEDFNIYTTWIETEFLETLTKDAPVKDAAVAPVVEDEATERVVVEVGGKRIEVVLPASLGLGSRSAGRRALGSKGPGRNRRSGRATVGAAGGDALSCPMQGTIVKVAVADGDVVAEGDLIAVLEAMKMEQPLTAHKAGKITGLRAAVGDSVSSGTVLCTINGEPATGEAALEPQPSA